MRRPETFHFRTNIKGQVRKRDKRKCQACGTKGVEVHHIVPLSKGGSDEPENLALMCSQCHDDADAGLLKFARTFRGTGRSWYRTPLTPSPLRGGEQKGDAK